MGYDLEESQKMARAENNMVKGEDYGPLQNEAMELRKRVEALHLQLERMERKFRPVLRSVPDTGEESPTSPRLMQAELTECLSDINRSLGALDLRMGDMISRCEL